MPVGLLFILFVVFLIIAIPVGITLGITAGIDPKTMQGLCGHSNTATTMNIYAKVVNEQLPKGIEQLDRFIG